MHPPLSPQSLSELTSDVLRQCSYLLRSSPTQPPRSASFSASGIATDCRICPLPLTAPATAFSICLSSQSARELRGGGGGYLRGSTMRRAGSGMCSLKVLGGGGGWEGSGEDVNTKTFICARRRWRKTQRRRRPGRVDACGQHTMACPYGGAHRRHECLQSALVYCIRQAGGLARRATVKGRARRVAPRLHCILFRSKISAIEEAALC